MIGFFTFIVIPPVSLFIVSLLSWQLYRVPALADAKNYVDLFNGIDSAFTRALLNIAIFAVFYTILNLVLSTLVTVWLYSIEGKLTGLSRVIFLVPAVTPMAANALIRYLMFDKDGVVSAFLSISGISPTPRLASEFWAMVVLVMASLWQIIGYNIAVLGSRLNNIDPSVSEAARVDGVGPFKRFFKVTFSLLSPALSFCIVITPIGAFKIFVQSYMLTEGGPGDPTITIVLYLYSQGFSYDKLGHTSATAWVLFIIAMLITALQFIGQKKWVNYSQ